MVTALDAAMYPDDTAAWLAGAEPGPDAAGPLAMLDPARLSATRRIDALVAIERQLAWLSRLQQRLLAAMADHAATAAASDDRLASLEASWAREDVACALRLSAVTAQAR